jgi:hypothetical protein
MLMYLRRGVLPPVAVSPVYTFGAPAVFCEGDCSCGIDGSGPARCSVSSVRLLFPCLTLHSHCSIIPIPPSAQSSSAPHLANPDLVQSDHFASDSIPLELSSPNHDRSQPQFYDFLRVE